MKFSEEHRRKLSEAKKGKPSNRKGIPHTLESRRKMSLAKIGKKRLPLSEKHKKKISDSLKGENHPYFGKEDENTANWKGDDVGYDGLHVWVAKHLGKPMECEYCGANGLSGKQIHWANKDHRYQRNLNDWLRLCALCHRKYDEENGIRGLNHGN